MSLRLRLLLAVGAIAIVALVVADVATYSALRSSLYNQVDQELAAHPQIDFHVDTATGLVQCPSPHSSFGGTTVEGGPGPGPGSAPGVGDRGGFANIFGISYASVVNQKGSVVDNLECPAYVGKSPYRPQLPAPITGFTTQPDGTQVVYFTDLVHHVRGPVVPGPGGEGSGRRGGRAGGRRSSTRPAPCTPCS